MNDKTTDEMKVPTNNAATRTQQLQQREPQRAHILIVDASSDYIDQLRKRFEGVNLPLETPKGKPLTREQQAELESERRDEGYGTRPIVDTPDGWAIDAAQEKQALKEQNSKRFAARHSDANPFRHCTLEFIKSSNPDTVLARVKAGEPKIDAVITGLSVYGSKGAPDYYGLAVANTLAAQKFDGVVAISAVHAADSFTLKEEARKAGAIGLFDKGDDRIFNSVREALENRAAALG